MDYNLIDKPWIPLTRKDGSSTEVGLRDALSAAHEYADVHDPSPLVTAALLRFLIAVLHRTYDGPRSLEDWKTIWKKGHFNAKSISEYLEAQRGRFGLFNEKHPFYQVSSFEVAEKRPVAQLAQELAGGNNPTLFDHHLDLNPSIFPSPTCARFLVANQAFALGGGKGATSKTFGEHPYLAHGPLVGGVLAFLKGDTLFQTLMLNLLCYGRSMPTDQLGQSDDDKPSWEREKPQKPRVRSPYGWLDLLTWQSRCVRLIPEGEGARWMFYAQGQKLKDPRPREPMWFYEYDEKDPEVPRAVRLDPGKALWRSCHALFAFAKEGDPRRYGRSLAFDQAKKLYQLGVFAHYGDFRCLLIGLASEKAKPLLWARELLPVPSRLLENEDSVALLRNGLQVCEKAGEAVHGSLYALAANLLVSEARGKTERKADKREAGRLADSLQGDLRYWSSMELPFKDFLSRLAEKPEAAMADWLAAVRRKASLAFEAASDCSLSRGPRELCARVKAGRILGSRLRELNLIGKEVTHERSWPAWRKPTHGGGGDTGGPPDRFPQEPS